MQAQQIKIGIVTVSDRASRGEYEDLGGPAIREWFMQALSSPWQAVARVVPDEQSQIEALLCELADDDGCCLIVTTGGTGPAKRDVTPEATRAVIETEVPGLSELMRAEGIRSTPLAVLSRAVAGVRKRKLIVNLPGSPRGARESLDSIMKVLPHAIDQIQGRTGHGE